MPAMRLNNSTNGYFIVYALDARKGILPRKWRNIAISLNDPRLSNPASLRLADTHPVLPVRPQEPHYPRNQAHPDDGVELVEVLSQRAPVLAQLHAEPGQREAPRPRSQEGVDVKLAARHARDARRQGDKGPDHRQQARDKNRCLSPAQKEAVRHVGI